ncbi:hypothetical protein C8A05DRAFT_12577 [Staphylotrichum tortipilum]|uniref:Ubiquitin-like protease family profile domain-containing protein n=1 Tax=Staphylotrichum tortipilum TaxID=2831512 RepID=A0AAN6MSB5_9PEZI|nr:hypothetical protein C8A05DRAFT_12577 [Staphylotrichum longicolle]
MPSQALTPRTTRNSRGLRTAAAPSSDPFVGSSSRTLSRALEAADPATPTPVSRFAPPAPPRDQVPALGPIPEEQHQPTTPIPVAGPSTLGRPPIFPPPVVLPPATPYPTTPHLTTSFSSPLEHPRLAAIRSTPSSAGRNNAPRTPARRPRFITRFVDATPPTPRAPTPKSPDEEETRLFAQRREQEDEDNFARELWISIRNDGYMRDCWCGPPPIYSSREEAESASGHLRFYVVGSETKNLRVLQKKNDFGWHCVCGNEYHVAYKPFLNANGKRPAEDTEFDLIAQNQDSASGKRSQSIDRVVPAPTEPAPPTPATEEQPQAPGLTLDKSPAPAQSMWSQAYDTITRAVATMGGPLAAIFGKLREQLQVDSYEAVDTRSKDAANNDAITVKRLKRRVPVSPTAPVPSNEEDDDGFNNLVWTTDPTNRIGFQNIQHLLNAFESQRQHIKAGRIIDGPSIAVIQAQLKDGQDLGTSIAVHKYREHKYGPLPDKMSEDEQADQFLRTLAAYYDRLGNSCNFMVTIYDSDLVSSLQNTHPNPPRRLPLGGSQFRQSAMMVAEFLGFVRSLDAVRPIDTATLETISQMIVDANAVHKQELLPSYVELRGDVTEAMPGYFPEEKVSPIEELPAEEFKVQALYDYRFPGPEPSEAHIRPGDLRLVPEPKGILKPSKEFDAPPSPKYVATPEKKRKLAFVNPVSKFIPPTHIPTQIMSPGQAEKIMRAKFKADLLRDEHSLRMFEAARTVSRNKPMGYFEDQWSLEAVERDDREMGLTHFTQKYNDFFSDLQDDMVKREEKQQENNKTQLNVTPRRRMVRIPLPPLPSTPEMRQRLAHLFEDDTSSPEGSTPGVNPLSRLDAFMRPKVEETPKPAKKPEPATLEEFFAADDDDLEISILKLEQIQIDRQIQDDFVDGVHRLKEEKRRREEEAALREKRRLIEEERRRKEEERRRQEEERRKQEDERRREQAAQQAQEADEEAALTGLRRPSRPLITDLSTEWNHRVTSTARTNPTAELAKTLDGQPLTRRDFEEKLLPPTAWLNDNIIIGSILHVADYINKSKGATDQDPKCAALTSFFWPRFISQGPGACSRIFRRAGLRKGNLLNIDTILIPICDQSHWTLAVVRPGRRAVSHIDSMRAGAGDERVKTKLLELMRFLLEDEFVEADWSAVDYAGPRQTNGWDCGVFTITNAICMALGLNPKFTYTERELTLQRRRLAAMLLNGGFKGDFTLDGF